MRVLAAPDKFRGTASAADVAAAVAIAARQAGWRCTEAPLADGGEGMLEALGGPNRSTLVTGPLGDPVEAGWRLRRGVAVVEMAQAAGLALIGGPAANDPVAAATHGVGELISAAVDAGARRVIVGMGGSATTDGGLGALRAMYPLQRYRAVELVVACDVRTTFLDAAEVFAPQKGASPNQVELLRRRLERLAQVYVEDYGVDVIELVGGGAAGGLAGGLAAAGAVLEPGFELIAEELELVDLVEGADLVVTGEGFLDEQSFDGKVVGGVIDLASELDVPVLAVVGQAFDGADERVPTISLVERFGEDRALTDTLACVIEAVSAHLAAV